MNDYYLVRFNMTPCMESETDILAALLGEKNFESFVPDAEGLSAYVKKGVSRFLVGINFRHPNVMPNFAVWKTITYRHWHRWCCQPRF